MVTEKDIIGSGWSFPPAFNKNRKAVNMLTGKEDIDSSLYILLSTTMGERIMQPEYGCNLKQFLFEPANESLRYQIKKLVEDAVLYFEPRIRPENVDLQVRDGMMRIMVEYTVKTTNSRGNFVYPFYLKEGTMP